MVLIDPPLFLSNGFIQEIGLFIKNLTSSSYEEFINLLVDDLLVNSNKINRTIAFESFMTVDKESLKEMFESLIEWDKRSKSILPLINIPSLCVLTNEHHCNFESIKTIAPKFTLGKVIESKCWATLDVPEQVNAMIERFLIIHNTSKSDQS